MRKQGDGEDDSRAMFGSIAAAERLDEPCKCFYELLSYYMSVACGYRTRSLLHTAVGVASHPKITTHPSVNAREEDERWAGEVFRYVPPF